jgi:hypothetical protein
MGYDNKEQQKIYNEKYYAENKAKIEAKIGLKENCPHCDRCVRHQNIQKHIKSKYCKTRRLLKLELEQEAKTHLEKED